MLVYLSLERHGIMTVNKQLDTKLTYKDLGL
jgi:hypothetical protein